MEFQREDIVKFKAGGPTMLVIGVGENEAGIIVCFVQYWNGKKFVVDEFEDWEIELIKRPTMVDPNKFERPDTSNSPF